MKQLMLGNKAVARGLYEAGVLFASSYPGTPSTEITEELETEVLVVGCGTGGWIAGMTAAEEGAKVLIVEKADAPTKIKEDIGAINSKLQLESFKDFPEFEIDKIQALQDIVRYASGYVDSDLVKTWMDNSGELVDWLTNILEGTGHWFMQLEGGIGDQEHPERDKAYATGHSPHPTEDKPEDVTLNTDMQAFIEERGGEIRCNTSLVKLDVDVAAGRVTGIIAQDTTDGHYIRIKATKGTIMATGGYASNTEMMLALQPQTMKMKINVPMGSKSDGAGIKAMLWAGAQMDPCHASMMFNRCHDVQPLLLPADRDRRLQDQRQVVLVRRAAVPEGEPERKALLQRVRPL